jgi:hypothetical protein
MYHPCGWYMVLTIGASEIYRARCTFYSQHAFLARELLLLALVLFHLEPLCPRICIGPLCVLPGLLLRSALCILRPLLLPLHLISLLHYRTFL